MDDVVSTPSGRLRGREMPGVMAFRGVPYGAPPVGARRFRAPEPAAPWQGEREAREVGATAPQVIGLMRDLPPQSEDCLTLNVWTPALQGRRPVMVFVHGGAFTTGSSAHPMYDAGALAARGDVVVVSFNYRLGVLGFADLAALDGSAFDSNPGLRDQLLALRWVQQHIEAFGGDPEQVTLFGQSAGAMSAVTLLASVQSEGLFSRVIAQSGAGHHTVARDESGRIAERFCAQLGVGAGALERLRALPLDQLLEAQAKTLRGWVRVGTAERPLRSAAMTLVPAIDGELIDAPPVDIAGRGAARDIPLLVGTNRDEWDFWLFLSDPSKRKLDEASMLKVVEKRVPGRGREAVALYRALTPDAPVYRSYGTFETDRVFGVPARRLAERRAAAGARSWLYEFDWPSTLFGGDMGALHTLEVPFVLGSVDEDYGRLFTGGGEGPQRLSGRMMDAWVAFARTGDPSTEALGEWPAFAPATPARMRLAARSGMQPCPAAAREPFWRELL